VADRSAQSADPTGHREPLRKPAREMPPPDDTSRVALVTGSAGGIMRGVCVSLARRGFRIAANYRPQRGNAEETVAAVRAAGGDCVAFAGDVSTHDDARALVAKTEARFGRIDALVCGAGPMLVKDLFETTADDFASMIDGNLTSVFHSIKAVLPIMRAQNHGRIIAFGMTGSEVTQAFRHLSAYVSAKSAVTALIKTLALEEGPYGITCNVVCPGDIRDKDADRATALERREYRNPTMRPGSWEDIGDAVAYLASDEASFVTGAVLTVNGGWPGVFEKYSRWP
jgi:3-oxoacyl-[acyl-carrier protein] reductase